MAVRDIVDKNNINKVKKIISKYPNDTFNLLNGYINSMSRKTSYTKLEYTKHVCKFIDYIINNLKYINNSQILYASIKPMDIDSYMEFIRYTNDGKEKSGMYRAAQLAAIKSFFKFLKKNGIVNTNPCDDTEVPKETKEHQIVTISEDDYKKILHNINYGVGSMKAAETQRKWRSRDLAIIMLGLTTGLRLSAIVGIDIDDIDFDKKTITVVEKANTQRTIYIGNNMSNILENWLCDRELLVKDDNERAVFISQTRNRMSPRAMEYIMDRLTYGTSVRITPHKMRATCATRLYEQTGDIYLVQQQLGHKSIKNTERYAKVSDERRIQAANILDSLY